MNKSIILGVTGSIAAYKSADIVSGLVRTGHNVNVVMTSSATKFVTPLTLETLSKNKVYVDMFEDAELVFAAAAVSNFKPKTYSTSKIKKSNSYLSIELELNKDILFELGRRKKDQFLVGFAAESECLFENAQAKLEKKNLDMITANHLTNFSSRVISHIHA